MKKRKTNIKHVAHGATIGLGGTAAHHLASDWTIHGVLHEITHNGIITAIGAAVILTVIELVKSKWGA